MNPLTFLPKKFRLWVYLALSTIGALLTATAAGFGGIDQHAPNWVVFGLAAVGSLSTVTNAVAASHVYKDAGDSYDDPAPVD